MPCTSAERTLAEKSGPKRRETKESTLSSSVLCNGFLNGSAATLARRPANGESFEKEAEMAEARLLGALLSRLLKYIKRFFAAGCDLETVMRSFSRPSCLIWQPCQLCVGRLAILRTRSKVKKPGKPRGRTLLGPDSKDRPFSCLIV